MPSVIAVVLLLLVVINGATLLILLGSLKQHEQEIPEQHEQEIKKVIEKTIDCCNRKTIGHRHFHLSLEEYKGGYLLDLLRGQIGKIESICIERRYRGSEEHLFIGCKWTAERGLKTGDTWEPYTLPWSRKHSGGYYNVLGDTTIFDFEDIGIFWIEGGAAIVSASGIFRLIKASEIEKSNIIEWEEVEKIQA